MAYRADIITGYLPDTSTLAQRLAAGPVNLPAWTAIGRCIRRFHDYGLCHADLNAHNILLRGDAEVFLIDFDGCTRRKPGLWRDANLARLRRSLDALEDRRSTRHFDDTQWAVPAGRLVLMPRWAYSHRAAIAGAAGRVVVPVAGLAQSCISRRPARIAGAAEPGTPRPAVVAACRLGGRSAGTGGTGARADAAGRAAGPAVDGGHADRTCPSARTVSRPAAADSTARALGPSGCCRPPSCGPIGRVRQYSSKRKSGPTCWLHANGRVCRGLLVSARVSARSLRRYRRMMPRLMRDAVHAFASSARKVKSIASV